MSHSIALTWAAVTLNTDGSTISGAVTYNLYQGTALPLTTKVQTGLTTNAATVTAGLTPGTTDLFAVTAVADGGAESAQSTDVSVVIPPLVPAAPTGLTATLS